MDQHGENSNLENDPARAERGAEKLRGLVDPSATSEQFLGAWQLCAADGGGAPGGEHHRFVHAQQVRCAVQRQELASQLPAVLLRPRGNPRVLALCAAPGSKSCQLLEQLAVVDLGLLLRPALQRQAGADT